MLKQTACYVGFDFRKLLLTHILLTAESEQTERLAV